MFQVLRKVDYDSLSNEELASWLDDQFQTKIANQQQEQAKKDKIKWRLWLDKTDKMQKWGIEFNKHVPKSLGKSLFYICESSTTYFYQNYVSRISLHYTWPLFFEKFPLGQIWLPKISKQWWDEIWQGEKQIAQKTGYNKKHPEGFHPQEASGLQAENFPLTALNILICGIYPLILCDYIHTSSDLVFVYIPDRAFKYSQMIEGRTLYQELLWKIPHVFNDQWTFDGFRGPKTAVDVNLINPIKQLGYFDWFIGQISNRMCDIVAISDPFVREQLGMTINRAICDAQLCITCELPYMSKFFFFGCLDKLANLALLLNMETNEIVAWKRLVDKQFLSKEVLAALKGIPDSAGEYLRWIVKHALEEMKLGDLSPQDLRDIRNSQHGYKLRFKTFERLMEKTGEINNDITLIVTPLILFFLSKKWKIK